MIKIKGIGSSNGISIAKSFILSDDEINISEEKINNTREEITKFENAKSKTEEQILKLKENALKNLGEEKANIFDAHIGILNDPEMHNQVVQKILDEKLNCAFSVKIISNNFKNIFLSMDDEYMKERASDINDVSNRLIKNILGIKINDLSLIQEEVIIVAHDLTPSETSQLNPKFIKGFITEIGGRTSHSAIMARTLEIPAIVGVGNEIFQITNNEKLLIDGNLGEIIISPSKETTTEYLKKAKILKKEKEEELKFKNKESKSKDGWLTKVASNIGSPKDLKGYLENNGDGIGLFRSEFLYMGSDNWPTEEEQFEAYKKVVETVGDKKTVIRTLDIGGDKILKYFKFPKELNPFLGYRAIRLQLDKKEILITQARALLRASAFGKLAINIPMISTIEEFLETKKVFVEVEKNLKKEGIKIGKYELGIMVEVPSVVELIDKFSKYVDFFSIGTNDLIQYTFAADRMLKSVSYLYQPFSPIILRKIKKVIDESHKHKKWTAICGELAGEPLLTPVFVGMGLDEFSMSSTSILKIRRLISLIDKKKAEKLVEKVINFENQDQVIEEIKKFLKDNKIDFYN